MWRACPRTRVLLLLLLLLPRLLLLVGLTLLLLVLLLLLLLLLLVLLGGLASQGFNILSTVNGLNDVIHRLQLGRVRS